MPHLVTFLLGNLVDQNAEELQRAADGTGKVTVAMEIHFANGRPRWHSATAHWVEHRTYPKETPVG